MEPMRKNSGDKAREAEESDRTRRVIEEIARDARSLEERYPNETIVPEGGE